MQSKFIASIITTTRHNVGDDFIRAGIQSLISRCLEELEDPSQRNIDYRLSISTVQLHPYMVFPAYVLHVFLDI